MLGHARIVAAALTAAAVPASAHPARVVEFTVSLTGVQTTSWTAQGTYAWCPDSTQRLPYDGHGQATLRLSLPGGARVALKPGGTPSFAATLAGSVERTGSFVEHDAAVTSRPPGCPPLADGDAAEDASGCGQTAASLAVATSAGTPPVLRSRPGGSAPVRCPWMTDVHEDGAFDTPPAILTHVEASDGLAPLALPGLHVPGPHSFAPSSATGTGPLSWEVAIPGGTLDVTTSTQIEARVALLPAIQPGRSIAGIGLGESIAKLKRTSRRFGGFSVSDVGTLVDSDHRWEWDMVAAVPWTDAAGQNLREDVWVSAPAGGARSNAAHRIVVTHRRPPANARVTRVETASTIETTSAGVGEGSTLADVRRAQPHGRLLRFGPPIAWLVDGPGRRRTAFMVFRGVVQSVQIGCRQTDPKQRGAPVDEAAVC
jgi:hypothetical protein